MLTDAHALGRPKSRDRTLTGPFANCFKPVTVEEASQEIPSQSPSTLQITPICHMSKRGDHWIGKVLKVFSHGLAEIEWQAKNGQYSSPGRGYYPLSECFLETPSLGSFEPGQFVFAKGTKGDEKSPVSIVGKIKRLFTDQTAEISDLRINGAERGNLALYANVSRLARSTRTLNGFRVGEKALTLTSSGVVFSGQILHLFNYEIQDQLIAEVEWDHQGKQAIAPTRSCISLDDLQHEVTLSEKELKKIQQLLSAKKKEAHQAQTATTSECTAQVPTTQPEFQPSAPASETIESNLQEEDPQSFDPL